MNLQTSKRCTRIGARDFTISENVLSRFCKVVSNIQSQHSNACVHISMYCIDWLLGFRLPIMKHKMSGRVKPTRLLDELETVIHTKDLTLAYYVNLQWKHTQSNRSGDKFERKEVER